MFITYKIIYYQLKEMSEQLIKDEDKKYLKKKVKYEIIVFIFLLQNKRRDRKIIILNESNNKMREKKMITNITKLKYV